MNREEAFDRLKRVPREFDAARWSISRTLPQVVQDPTIFRTDTLTTGDLRDCQRNLEVTYLTRIFAEFETVLRDFYWSLMHPQQTRRRTSIEAVIDRIAARQYIPADVLDGAHAVREYRNDVIHDGLRTPRLPLHDCKSRLAKYISYFPPVW
ncbi:MAG: hypothetical protein HY718_16190 [Planctomycetes bacterium]|nr:hypothetical protein [Planctomycetota bacterium]